MRVSFNIKQTFKLEKKRFYIFSWMIIGCCDCQYKICVVEHMECGELHRGIKFALNLKGTDHMNHVRSSIQHGSEVCYLTENDIGMLK